ncbi:hypothetical protein [Nocardioides sp.]|uniref:hypothetical protein n=1 Tax=Nocardioides sp. TaxID=35761 RepID=UPI002726B679|nr:hypothetical protein [Nocardioides sp.]MDO9456264.1 hypothetical protein [Nocardioides sp.]
MRSLVVLVLLAALTACGSDDEPVAADQVDVADTVSTEPTSQPTSQPTTEPTTDTPTPEPVDLGDDPLVTLTGDEVCAALTPAAATLALGTEVSQAEASDSETPQCTYTYGGDSATLSTFTVAAQRPEDIGDRGLADAFDYVLEVNRGLAVDTEVEEADVAAGDRAARLTGETLTLAVVASGGHLLTIITTPDLDTTAVEALAATAADAVA